jgi:2-ketoarginine methyltransferase
MVDLADALEVDRERLEGVLRYLANEDLIAIDGYGRVRLTPAGQEMREYKPWYDLLVGGYGRSFDDLPAIVGARSSYAGRKGHFVAEGSCGISQFDALPMTASLLSGELQNVRTVVDIGCGDGSYLIELCLSVPGVNGIGFELDPEVVDEGNALATRRGLSDRVSMKLGRAATAIPELPDGMGPFCFVTAFVLQEILEQSGRHAVVELLRGTFNRYPDSRWIVIEVDHRPSDPAIMEHGLGLAYYNPYYLLHVVTEQRLETVDYWTRLFDEAGLRVSATTLPDPQIDSLGLKVGFLLASSGSEASRGSEG